MQSQRNLMPPPDVDQMTHTYMKRKSGTHRPHAISAVTTQSTHLCIDCANKRRVRRAQSRSRYGRMLPGDDQTISKCRTMANHQSCEGSV